MTNDNSPTTDQLLAELEELADSLSERGLGPHFGIVRSFTGWEVTVYVRPIDDPEVHLDAARTGGWIQTKSTDMHDALAGAVRICRAVARNQAVPA